MMTGKLRIGCYIAVAVVTLFELGIYAWLGSLSRFLADDYCVAYYAGHFGLLRSIWYWYISWGGTFSASIIDWLLVWIRPTGMRFIAPIVLILWLGATFAAIDALLREEEISRRRALTAGVLAPIAVLTILLLSPDVPQSLFWWTGMRAYVMPLILLPLWALSYRLFEGHVRRNAPNIAAWSFLSLAMSFIIGGFTETLAPAQLLLFAAGIFVAFMSSKMNFRNPRLLFLAAALLGALVSLIVVIAAPGNLNRQSYYPPPPGLISLLTISLRAYRLYIVNIIVTPQKIAGLLGAALAAFGLGTEFGRKVDTPSWLPAASLLAALAFSFACFVPAAWGLSDSPPLRTVIIAAFFLALGSLTAAFTAGSLTATSRGSALRTMLPTAVALTAFCLLSFAAYINGRNLYADRSAYLDYARKWETVNAQIIRARRAGSTVVHIPSMESWAELDTPNDNPKYWLNICYSKFYGLQVLSP